MTAPPGAWTARPPSVALGRTAFTWTTVAVMAVPCALLVGLLVLILVELAPGAGADGGGLGAGVLVVAVVVMLLVFGWSGIVRPLRSGVFSRGERLVVRGSVGGTHRVERAAVSDVHLSPRGAARIVIRTADGRAVVAPVTTRWPHGDAARAQAAEQIRLVRAWAGLPV